MNRKLLVWLGVTAIIILIFGTAYGLAQQDWRMSANIPLITAAETAAYQVEKGVTPARAVGSRVDPLATHQLFVSVYASNGQLLASSARINGAIPQLPPGVLSYVHPWQQHRFTWQMADGQRFATVATAVARGNTLTGYAIAAQHLDYVESEETHAADLALIGWALSLIVLTATVFVFYPSPK